MRGADGRLVLWLAPTAPTGLASLLERLAQADPIEGEHIAAGRGTVVLVRMEHGEQVLIRPYRRGGWAARLSSHWYWGWRARSLEELRILLVLEARGVPAVRGLAAAARWCAGGSYRAWLATRYWPGATTLWEWWQHAPRSPAREAVLQAVGHALVRLHRAGVVHPDLNATNILVRAEDPADPVRLVDFDRAHLCAHPSDPSPTLARLARSLRKLDPAGRVVQPADWQVLEQAVWRGFSGPRCP